MSKFNVGDRVRIARPEPSDALYRGVSTTVVGGTDQDGCGVALPNGGVWYFYDNELDPIED